jgi:hypothetical protein
MSHQTQPYIDEGEITIDLERMEATNLLLHFANTPRRLVKPEILEGASLLNHIENPVPSQVVRTANHLGNLGGGFTARGHGYGRGRAHPSDGYDQDVITEAVKRTEKRKKVAKSLTFESEQEASSDEEYIELPPQKMRKGNVSNNSISGGNPSPKLDQVLIDSSWSREDEVVLQQTCMEEQKLWRWCDAIFGMSPPKLLPESVRNVTFELRDITDPDDVLKTYKNMNWSIDFCTNLAIIICCPAFHEHVGWFQYALLLAIHYRLGVRKYQGPRPSRAMLTTSRNHSFIDDLEEGFHMDQDDKRWVLALVEKTFGLDGPPDLAFNDYLSAAVSERLQQITKAVNGATKRDLVAIIRAWDLYSEQPDKVLTLRKMGKYREIYSRVIKPGVGRRSIAAINARSREILEKKKAWIIGQRRAGAETRGS